MSCCQAYIHCLGRSSALRRPLPESAQACTGMLLCHYGLRQSAEAHAVCTADHNMPKGASMQHIQPASAVDRLEESQGLPKFQSLKLTPH